MTESEIASNPKICRLCLALTATSFSLIDDTKASEMLAALTSLKISPSDEISTVMCLKCCLNLKLAFAIQQNMLQAEQRFQRHCTIKQESDTQDEVDIDDTQLVEEEQTEGIAEHVCDTCGKLWPSKSHVLKHQIALHVEVLCPICRKVFNKASIKQHLEEVHVRRDKSCDLEKYVCDVCGCEGLTRRGLYMHKFDVHGVRHKETQLKKDDVLDHGCDICGKNFSSKTSLRHHKYGVHLKAKCPICSKEFKKGNLSMHISRHGPSNTEVESTEPASGKYVCDICEKIKFSQSDLTKHKYNVHIKYECPICKKTISQTNIKRHVERHNNVLSVCELCGASVKAQDFRHHMKNVHTLQEFKCGFCDKVFKGKKAKMAHEKREHLGEADFTCDMCGKRFYKHVHLKRHINSTHLKMRPHICDFCKVGFSSKFAMMTHRRQHTNERPYKCEFCAESFRQKVSLKTHLRSQHNFEEELTCKCEKCGKKFASKFALFSHRRVHP